MCYKDINKIILMKKHFKMHFVKRMNSLITMYIF